MRPVLRVAATGLVPCVVIVLVALLHSVVRGLGVAVFGLVLAYKAADVALGWAGELVPRPHWKAAPRPVPAPEVSPR